MLTIALHLILPAAFYTLIAAGLSYAFGLGPLEATAVSALLTLPLLYYFYEKDQTRRHIRPAISFRLNGCFWYIVLLAFSLCILGNQMVEFLGLKDLSESYKEVEQHLYSPSFPVQLLTSGLLIPLAEEFLFRGMVFAPVRDRVSFVPSAFLSALLFGLFHGNLPQGIYSFFIGLVLAWLYETCKTLLAPYVFHGAANCVSLAVVWIYTGNTGLSKWLQWAEPRIFTAVFLSVCLGLSVFCVILIYKKKQVKEEVL